MFTYDIICEKCGKVIGSKTFDRELTEYERYQKLVKAEFCDDEILDVIPESLSIIQFRVAAITKIDNMDIATLEGLVGQIINTLPTYEKQLAQIRWEYANLIDRQNPLLNIAASILGLSAKDIDKIFRYGYTV